LPMYAAAGIPEAWIFNLIANRIERHTNPGPSGYRTVSFADDGQAALIATASGVRRFVLDPLAWEQTACTVAGRVLDEREWADYVGDEPYRPVCSG